MSDKEMALQRVRQLDDNASAEEIAEELQILASIRIAERAADEGRVVPHEAAQKMFDQWISK